ncbi:MAG: phosphoglycerate kinase, partial [Prevotella denticola]
LPAAAGLLVGKEIESLGRAVNNPERPYTVVLGGSKVSDKLGVIANLLTKADRLLIGGGMAYTFLAAQGNEVKGVKQTVVDMSDGCLEIPQFGTKHSLNVSVTAGIVIWEFARRLLLE